jgi:hypothetical protein
MLAGPAPSSLPFSDSRAFLTSWALLHGTAERAGSVRRVSAAEVEAVVIRSLHYLLVSGYLGGTHVESANRRGLRRHRNPDADS